VFTGVTGFFIPHFSWILSAISVKTAPTKVTYNAGEQLDLNGLVVKLTKSDSTTEDVALADFVAKGITTSPVAGAALASTDTKVTITHTASGKTVEQNITVEESVEPVEALIRALPKVSTTEVPEVPDVVKEPKPDSTTLDAVYIYLEYLKNADAVAEAKEAFDALKASSQDKVDANLEAKLNSAVAKIEELKSFVEENTTVSAWTATGGDGGKGRISINVVWPFYTEDGFNTEDGLTSLEEYLYNEVQNEIVRNEANLANQSPDKTKIWPTRITGSFDLGVARESNSWNTGEYNLIGDEVTQADLPDKVVVEFTYKGVLFVIEEEVEFTPDMFIAGAIYATPTTIQSELDNASDGTMFILNPGEYGTIYLRQSESRSRSVDVSNWAGDGDVERYREFKDISIVGTTGAKVDQITVEAMQYGTKISQPHSNSEYMTDYLSSYIAVENLTIKNIEFTGNKGPAVRLQSIWGHSSINGLTIDGCSLTGKAEHKTANESFLLVANGNTSKTITDKTKNSLIMTTGRSNLTVKNCTVDNVWMPINVTEWHGIDIRDNNFSNTGRNDIMITGPSVGDVNIIGNTLSNAAERSIRLNTITGKISITDNTIENCAGREITTDGTTEKSLMKISSSGDGTTVELSGNSWNGLNDAAAVEDNDQNILLESEGIAFTVK
jgi:hypothetical protein